MDSGISGGLKRKKLGSIHEVIKKIKEDPCITEHDEHILKAQLLCWNDKSKISALSMSGWYTRVEEKFGDSNIVYHCGKCSEIAKKKRIKQHRDEKRQIMNEQFKLDLDIKAEPTVAAEDEQAVLESFDDFEDVDNDYDDQTSDPDNETDQDSQNSHDDDEEAAGDAFIGDSDDNEQSSKNGYENEKNSNNKRYPASYSYIEGVQSNVTSLQGKCYKQNSSGNANCSNVTAATSSPILNPVIF